MVQIRAATAEDALGVAEAHVRSWQVGYRGLLPQEYLDGLDPADRAGRYDFGEMPPNGPFTMVAIDGAAICGHVTTGLSRDAELPNTGEVWALYVDPARWGGGIGRVLMTAACARLRDQGLTRASLWVIAGNSRARRFYEAGGWTVDGATRTDTVGATVIEEVRYRIELC